VAVPWYTSTTLISAVKRKISFPTSSNTFTDDDILAFANEEMMISQVPSVLEFHEEYFVTSQSLELKPNVNRYPIPKRAIGMKLRDVFWSDPAGNLFEMTRINADDKAFFQSSVGANQAIHKFYLEGNEIVLTSSLAGNPTGTLVIYYFIRPNQLVTEDRAAIISSFSKSIIIDNTTLVAGDTLSISYEDPMTGDIVEEIFTAVAGIPGTNEFQIGGSSISTATNLAGAVNTEGTFSATNGSPATATVTVTYNIVTTAVEASNTAALNVSTSLILNCESVDSTVFEVGDLVDFLQTDGGHQILAIDVQIPANGVSTNTLSFLTSSVPTGLVVGDYICLAHECIIPQIPSDLHNGLAERTCARILAAIGDQQGFQITQGKIAEIDLRQGTLLDQRVEGAPQKVTGRHGLLRYFKTGVRRRV